jgi:hypothetical protein
MNVILLHSIHGHVSAIHVAVLRVARTRIQIQLQFVDHSLDGHMSESFYKLLYTCLTHGTINIQNCLKRNLKTS